MKLSDRLQLIANKINQGETMADIGTDHGFLPIYLTETGKCPHVIMSDISPGSLKKAADNCKSYNSAFQFDLRLGNGIDVLEDGEVDVVVLAGIGGLLAADILSWNMKKSRSIKKYIMQPRNNAGRLRHWLYCNGFEITGENLVREGRFICEVFTVEPGETFGDVPYSEVFDYPESLIEFKGPLTMEYLTSALANEETIKRRIHEGSRDAETAGRQNRRRIERLRELIERLGD